jgi:UDP-GlcNAc:undecaprenyl-phosphate GlcNAc-1-phosphate transferase
MSIIEFIFIFSVATACLYIFRKLARKIGLVDRPSPRKLHNGAVPLVGGVAICFTVVHYLYFNPGIGGNSNVLMFAVSILTLVGALDDKFDVSVKLRIVTQALVSLVMILYAGIVMTNMGNLLGFGDIELGAMALPVTVLAVLGAINAFNMVDGIDGLLGGILLVTFSSIAILMDWSGQPYKLYISILFIASITPFVFLNLGVFGRKRKVFMGDAGSMTIGFTVIWLLLGASQSGEDSISISPVTCLWLIAIPLMDMVSVIIRRIKEKRSPFKADREHIHHLLQNYHDSSLVVLGIICSFSAIFATVGVVGEVLAIPEYVMFSLFIVIFALYHSFVSNLSQNKSMNKLYY